MSVLAQSAPAINVPTCGAPLDSADAFFAQAEAEGYRALEPGTVMPEAIAERLSWVIAMPYLTADTGGVPLSKVLEMQVESAGNLTRLKDTPKSAARAFVYDDQAAMIIRWQETPVGFFSVHCSAALFLDDDAELPPTEGRYGDFSRRKIDSVADGLNVVIERFQLDRAAIRAEAPLSHPPHYIMTIVMDYSQEVLE